MNQARLRTATMGLFSRMLPLFLALSFLVTAQYIVGPGDNACMIAARCGFDLKDLVDANPQISAWNNLPPGQNVSLPAGHAIAACARQTSFSSGASTFVTSPSPSSLSGSAAPAPASATATTYTVVAGDTAYNIAIHFGITLDALKAANVGKVQDWDILTIGLVLTIPASSTGTGGGTGVATGASTAVTAIGTSSGTSATASVSGSSGNASFIYTVVQGDTASSIAARFGITLAVLEAANVGKVQDWDLLVIGLQLTIPGQTTTSTVVVTAGGTAITSPPTAGAGGGPSPQPTAAATTSVWTVASGDTGEEIAHSVSVPFFAISSANPTVTWTLLTVGETILIPPSPTALSQVTGTVAVFSLSNSTGSTTPETAYHQFVGDGSTSQGWPDVTEWLSWEVLWQTNLQYIGQDCVDNVTPNSAEESAQLQQAILTVGSQTGVDPRFIFVVVMQESSGCVRVRTTSNANSNPGLLQSYEGKGTCNRNGQLDNPCPASVIDQMIVDGTGAPVDGVTLVSAINAADDVPGGCGTAQAFYRAARFFNSGPESLPPSTNGDLGSSIDAATPCYASDIANRLLGWVNTGSGSPCTLGKSK